MGVTARFATATESVSGLLDRAAAAGQTPQGLVRRNWMGGMFAAMWLLYLIGPVSDVLSKGHLLRGIAGAVAVVGYGLLITVAFARFRRPDVEDHLEPPARNPVAWSLLAGMAVVVVAVMVLLGPSALPAVIYLAATAVFVMPLDESALIVIAVVLVLVIVSTVVPGWSLGGAPLFLTTVPIGIWIGRAMGLRVQRQRVLLRQQRAELAIVDERNRVARDVHDILGHSLTVITVKTELAQRLLDIDPERARAEMADVERLAREALAGVRDTVGGLREMSLTRELANARSALGAADIATELPPAVVATEHDELFGWVLREAVTNVVRHSRARTCTVEIGPNSIVITDDGVGLPTTAASGSGLTGLQARVRAAGGSLTLSTPAGGGLRLAVAMRDQR
ncbi:sensor histidine kinase [Nocardia stercoris]|uniref:Sensor histidine kinase n=1 Tax=Nocardia stercoris TaxID=2483361 RepID=A0A3M2L5Q2_9NOCA|nr:sensor histidine kinase [Nocardia stercoris]RMI32941.1 sensor histidine kinase [Nocardia stercoris]